MYTHTYTRTFIFAYTNPHLNTFHRRRECMICTESKKRPSLLAGTTNVRPYAWHPHIPEPTISYIISQERVYDVRSVEENTLIVGKDNERAALRIEASIILNEEMQVHAPHTQIFVLTHRDIHYSQRRNVGKHTSHANVCTYASRHTFILNEEM